MVKKKIMKIWILYEKWSFSSVITPRSEEGTSPTAQAARGIYQSTINPLEDLTYATQLHNTGLANIIHATHKTFLISQTGGRGQASSRSAGRPTDAGASSKSQWIWSWHRLLLYTHTHTHINGAGLSDDWGSHCPYPPVLSTQEYALTFATDTFMSHLKWILHVPTI